MFGRNVGDIRFLALKRALACLCSWPSVVSLIPFCGFLPGANTWQWMYGCELRRDGSKVGYYQCAFNGRHYISLDKETLTWIAADVPAQNTKRKWEAEPGIALIRKVYLEEECIEWLQRYLEYGKEILLRTASNLWLIIVCVVGVALLVSGMAGFAVYFKKPPQGYKGPSEIKQGSNSSGTALLADLPWKRREEECIHLNTWSNSSVFFTVWSPVQILNFFFFAGI
nr:PREDICTED: uncharacterized protein LOC107982488 [Anolis carolinensis]XP_016847225.1 PREDICTED: uncharacterized protein LOC107982488 [Anolis carolinensis]|eukprot:XP_016847224.1 PREDICTED: uncharacterized protein LOC107982488 [Anolis carolinensis]